MSQFSYVLYLMSPGTAIPLNVGAILESLLQGDEIGFGLFSNRPYMGDEMDFGLFSNRLYMGDEMGFGRFSNRLYI
ncbi:hypothetical protein NG799_28865 [Laspinema sp. D1]|uniref:Uncharacterized protein n=1 Tax=Laspinema palackyanum D2a TaxID=2953684 RepID=A0ABT2N007_9CYAN|nr:hypothetical protein [Laspinema sp. D2a]